MSKRVAGEQRRPPEAENGRTSVERAAVRGVRLARVEAVMGAARRSGLLDDKTSRIAGRLSPALISKAKAQTGIDTDTDLIEFALASVAIEDDFAMAFKAVRGTVDPDLDLGL